MRELAAHLEKIPVFLAVYRCGAFHRAARELKMAQPSLSYSIGVLESALGVALFRRTRRGVEPTTAGHTLHDFAAQLLAAVADVEARIQQPGDPLAGWVTVGTYDVLAVHIWPEILARAGDEMPQLNVDLKIHISTGELVEACREGNLDVVMVAEPQRRPGLERHFLFTETLGFFVGGARQVPARATLEWLAGEPLIAFRRAIAGSRRTMGDALAGLGLREAVRYDMESYEAVLSFVRRGLGVGVLPRVLVRRFAGLQGLREVVIPGLDEVGSQKIYAVHRKDRERNPRVQAILRQTAAVLSL